MAYNAWLTSALALLAMRLRVLKKGRCKAPAVSHEARLSQKSMRVSAPPRTADEQFITV